MAFRCIYHFYMPQRPQSQVTLLSPVAPRSHPAARMMNWVGMHILIRGMCHQHRLPTTKEKEKMVPPSQQRGVSAFLITIVQHRRGFIKLAFDCNKCVQLNGPFRETKPQ